MRITTPLGLLALVVLVAEAILTVVAARVGAGTDRTIIVSGMIGLLAFVVLSVVLRGDTISGEKPRRFELIVVIPQELGLTNRDVDWAEKSTFLLYGDHNTKVPVSLIGSTVSGSAFHVRLPDKFIRDADGDTHCELQLTDKNGVKWKVARFYLFKIQQQLSAPQKDLLRAYSYNE